jgi:hypothetical protein
MVETNIERELEVAGAEIKQADEEQKKIAKYCQDFKKDINEVIGVYTDCIMLHPEYYAQMQSAQLMKETQAENMTKLRIEVDRTVYSLKNMADKIDIIMIANQFNQQVNAFTELMVAYALYQKEAHDAETAVSVMLKLRKYAELLKKFGILAPRYIDLIAKSMKIDQKLMQEIEQIMLNAVSEIPKNATSINKPH